MKQWLISGAVILATTMMAVQAAPARSLLHDVEHSLHGVERNLCANIPSKKCKTTRKSKASQQKPDAPTLAPVKPVAPSVTSAPKPAQLTPPVPAPVPVEKSVPVAPPTPASKSPDIVSKPVPLPPPPPILATPAPTAANDDCLHALAATGATFSPVPQPGSSAECVVENPVKLISLKTSLGMVKLPDQPTVRCSYARALEDFVSTKVQPLAQSEMQSPIAAMGTGPGFDCRGRNGDSAAKISEHAKGNAVDIVFFTFANKNGVLVKDALNAESSGFSFLRDVRAEACKAFTTVLGPGANSAHAEHFHIDLEERKGGYRICE